MISRLARWWLARGERRRRDSAYVPAGECCAPRCGVHVEGDDLHSVVALSTDDASLGIEGQTGMVAEFCAEHCPGGCRRGCATMVA